MIQVCDPPRVPVRGFPPRNSVFFCSGARQAVFTAPAARCCGCFTVGEVCGVCDAAGAPGGAVLLQPLNADTALCRGPAAWAGWRGVEGGQFLTPPVLHQPDAAEPLLRAAFCPGRARLPGAGGCWRCWNAPRSPTLCCRCTSGRAGAAGPAPAEQSGTLLLCWPPGARPGTRCRCGCRCRTVPGWPSAGKRVCGIGQPTDRRAGDLAGHVPGITTRV